MSESLNAANAVSGVVTSERERMQAQAPRDRYSRVMGLIATDKCVILDGATGTELIGVTGQRPEVEEHLWGLTARDRVARRREGRAPPLRRRSAAT